MLSGCRNATGLYNEVQFTLATESCIDQFVSGVGKCPKVDS